MEQTEGQPRAEVISLAGLLAEAGGAGPIWTRTSADLNVNVLSVPAALAGEGELRVDGAASRLGPGDLCLIPRGSVRSTHATGDRFVYLTCHRRRGGLMPA
jgi:quercetin dioxygenase-like cupin family protein